MSDDETMLELTRVLVEAGEAGAAVDWIEGELRLLDDDALRVLVDPEADPVEYEKARRIHNRLLMMFAELRELADDDEKD